MPTTVDINGFTRSLAEYETRQKAALVRAITVFCHALIGRAQELCPQSDPREKVPGAGPPHGKDMIKNPAYTGHSGFLRNSAVVEDPVVQFNSIVCTVGFNAEYAAAVHELLDHHHANGQAKYLETAMREMAPKFKDFIQAELAKEFGN